MRVIEFAVPGVPIAQPRAKATRRGPHTRMYTPEKTASGKSNGIAEFKAAMRLVAASHITGTPMAGPLRVDLEFVFPRHPNKFWKTKPTPRYRHVQKPDRDNLEKSVYDALTGVLWVDDCQVCDGVVSKWHASADEGPHVRVVVTELE